MQTVCVEYREIGYISSPTNPQEIHIEQRASVAINTKETYSTISPSLSISNPTPTPATSSISLSVKSNK